MQKIKNISAYILLHMAQAEAGKGDSPLHTIKDAE